MNKNRRLRGIMTIGLYQVSGRLDLSGVLLRFVRPLAVIAAIGAAACGGDESTAPEPPPQPNRPPVASASLPAQSMTAGESVTVNIAALFSDPDGDALTYTAESSDAGVVTASVSGSTLTVTAVAAGTATVTVTAADPDGLTATQSASVTVEAANQAPEAVGTIPPRTMTAGRSATLDLSPFFSDPDGDALTYTAESSDAGVVTASVSGSTLTVTAVAAGTATVTVTAADPDGLTATQSASVTVEAANQAPEAVGTIPPRTMTAGRSATLDLSPLFSDPDGDALTYTAESSDAGVVTASVSGSTLTVTAVAAGTATVTVTAADPGGLTATQSASVTVERDGGGDGAFRDDFTSSASLSDWEIINADAVVLDGLLRLTNKSRGDGLAFRELDKPITSTSWTIRARLGRATTVGRVSVLWDTGLDRRTKFRFDIGDAGDGYSYYLWVWDEEHFLGPGWYNVDDFDKSDAIDDGPNDLTTIAFGWQGEFFVAVAGDTELFRARPNQDFITEHGGDYSVTLGQITGISLVREDYSFGDASAGLFDWVEVIDGGSGAAAADVSGETSPIGAVQPEPDPAPPAVG